MIRLGVSNFETFKESFLQLPQGFVRCIMSHQRNPGALGLTFCSALPAIWTIMEETGDSVLGKLFLWSQVGLPQVSSVS